GAINQVTPLTGAVTGGGTYSATINGLLPGTHTAQTTFLGCGGCAAAENPSTSGQIKFVVTNTVSISLATVPAGSGNLGTNVQLNATLTTPGNLIPSGTLLFTITGPAGFTPINIPVNVTSLTPSASINTLPGGSYFVTATYTPVAGNGY